MIKRYAGIQSSDIRIMRDLLKKLPREGSLFLYWLIASQKEGPTPGLSHVENLEERF